jgi:tRNA (guanine26-N2/guanine27-N2)-dimethyltransferase
LTQKEPPKFPTFFNPAAKLNRDISIQIYKNFVKDKNENTSFVDTMAGTGIRGLRVANEIPSIKRIIFNDINPFSIYVSKVNAILNNMYQKCDFYNKEICNFLSCDFTFDKRATIIDIDPFGTPSSYLDCILRSIHNGGLISVTATDTAVLCGVYPKVCYRKYYGSPLRTKYSLEIGSRLLLSCIALIASRLDLYIQPIFSHGYRNYIRTYCKILKSNSFANKIQEKLGYVIHCFYCGYRFVTRKSFQIMNCEYCHNKVSIGGPLWISNIFDKKIVSDIVNSFKSDHDSIKSNDFLKGFFTIALEELDDYPFHYINDEIGKSLKKNVISVATIIDILKKNGFLSSKTVFATNGFKTNASLNDMKKLLGN